mmetsp:Transcript_84884/g.259156  ORF Transcript_84884/g.259156 Transcript_84884/m.259156 type:complete len:260 (-) Transcript_84884:93-872(-)
MRDAPVHLHGHLRGVCDLQVVQDLQWDRLEEDDLNLRIPLPGDLLHHLLHLEPADLGPEVLRRSPVFDALRRAMPLVWHLGAPCLPRSVLRVPQGEHRAARADEPDPQADPGPAVVHPPRVHGTGRRHLALRSRVHGTLLHHVVHMATPVLLPLRVLGLGAHHTPCDLRGDIDRPHVLPADLRRLQVVVASILIQRVFSDVCVLVLHIIFLVAVADREVGVHIVVLRVHVHHIDHVLLADGLGRLTRSFRLRAGDIWLN